MKADRVIDQIIDIPQTFHESGTISPAVLRKLHSATREMKIRRSVETGCGKSTLLLSWISAKHTVFTLPEYAKGVPSVGYQFVSEASLLNAEAVDFVLGPTQQTLPQWQDQAPIQLAFIDGPHGYPFPELEYYHLYPRLDTGALLVIDDIQIPTIRNLFEFLRLDRMFTLEEVVDKTAFFRRTAEPMFDPLGDGWWLQEYNLRYVKQPPKIKNLLSKVSRAVLGETISERIRRRIRRWFH
ncbi:MAG: class I SAM-dependent methyltransferase [Wenzhouxiangellaceae bacterium]